MATTDAEAMQHRLHDDWKHLAVRARRKTLAIVGEDGPDDPLVRLQLLSPDQYGFEHHVARPPDGSDCR